MSQIKKLYHLYLSGLSITAALELFHAARILGLPYIADGMRGGMTDRQIESHIFHECTDDQIRMLFNSTDSPLNKAHDPYWGNVFFHKMFRSGFTPFVPMSAEQCRAPDFDAPPADPSAV